MSKNKRLLMEGVEAGKFLADMMTSPVLFSLEEAEGGRHRAKGTFALADTPTSNRRIYPKKIWEREIGKLSKSISDRKLFGTLDHPEDGRTKLSEVSHIITKLMLDGNQVVGECDILDTVPGQNLKAIIKAGGKVGVSSRGVGSTTQVDEGEVVGEDYNLTTFDFVANPAEITAYPKMVVEEKLNQQGDKSMQLTEEVKKLLAEETEKVRAQMQEEFNQKSETMLAENEEQTRKLSELGSQLTEAKQTLKRVGFDMFLSNYLTEEDKKEAIMELLGDYLLLESVDVLKEKVDAIRKNVGVNEKPAAVVVEDKNAIDQKALTEDLKDIRTKIQNLVEEKQAQTKQLTEQAETIKTLEAKKQKLQEEFNTAVALAQDLGLRAYMEQKLHGNPRATRIRKMFEEQTPGYQGEGGRPHRIHEDPFGGVQENRRRPEAGTKAGERQQCSGRIRKR